MTLRPAIGRLAQLGTKIKTSSCVLLGMLTSDYSRIKLPMSWDDSPSRYDLINDLIAAYHYKSYLEIGCSTDACFRLIAAKRKVGVDPVSGGTHRMTSDEFFASNTERFDIIFVDGLHRYTQVKRDLINSLRALKDSGVILVHDCLPLSYRAQLPFPAGGAWNGDVWKAFVEVRTQDDVDAAVCLIDHGVGMIRRRPNQKLLKLGTQRFSDLRFKEFASRYTEWLNTVSYYRALRF